MLFFFYESGKRHGFSEVSILREQDSAAAETWRNRQHDRRRKNAGSSGAACQLLPVLVAWRGCSSRRLERLPSCCERGTHSPYTGGRSLSRSGATFVAASSFVNCRDYELIPGSTDCRVLHLPKFARVFGVDSRITKYFVASRDDVLCYSCMLCSIPNCLCHSSENQICLRAYCPLCST